MPEIVVAMIEDAEDSEPKFIVVELSEIPLRRARLYSVTSPFGINDLVQIADEDGKPEVREYLSDLVANAGHEITDADTITSILSAIAMRAYEFAGSTPVQEGGPHA